MTDITAFDPALVTIERKRFSITQGEALISYNGQSIEQYGDKIELRDGQWAGHDDAFWIAVAQREAIARGLALDPTPTPPTTDQLVAAFPDFDIATLPAIPADWTDSSWRNDTCPSFCAIDHQGSDWWNLAVYIDYADPAAREIGQTERFTVLFSHHLIDASPVDVLSTDDWNAVLAFVAGFDPATAISLPAELLVEVKDRASAEAWITALVAADLMFHFEDSPSTIINMATDKPIFTKPGAEIVTARVASLYEQEWGDLECPIGFALTLPGVAA